MKSETVSAAAKGVKLLRMLWIRGGGRGDTSRRAYVGKNGLDNIEVSHLGTTERGELEPDDEDGLEGKVPRNVVEDNAKGEGL